jgi:transglutaminase-like putative cysteine protease
VVVLERVITWLKDLVFGEPSFDPVAAGIVWSAAVWLVAAWGGWVIEARQNTLLAVLPAVLLNLSTLSYGQHSSFTIYLILGATLVLIAVVQYDQREQEWNKTNVAYPARKDRQIGYVAVSIAIGLVFISSFISSLSFQRITNWVTQAKGPSAQHESGLAKSLGIQSATTTPDAFTPVRAPGLPRELLIGSGPELSRKMVMSVEVKDLAGLLQAGHLPPLYWRSFTYDIYTGLGWSSSATEQSFYQVNQLINSDQIPGHQLIQEVIRPVPGGDGTIYAAGEPVSVNVPSIAAWRSSSDLFGIQTGKSGYEIQSLVPVVDETSLRAAGATYPNWIIQRYLQIQTEVPARVKDLAIQLTATEPTPYDRARAIEQYLRTYPYSLDVPRPPANQDLVDFFLNDLRKGYCDYYASAMVVLSRAAGIPARLAVGYATGTYNLNSKRFIVTQAEAHSWVEVYFPGIGWVPFEATAAQPTVDHAGQSTEEASPATAPPARMGGNGRAIQGKHVVYVGLGLIVLSFFGWAVYDEIYMRQLKPKPAAAEIYRRLRGYGKLLRVDTQAGETPFEFTEALTTCLQETTNGGVKWTSRLDSIRQIRSIAGQIVQLVYRPSETHAGMKSQIVSQWMSLRWRLRWIWLLDSWKKLQSRFMKWQAGFSRNSGEGVE